MSPGHPALNGYCIRCRRVVDVLVIDSDQGPWAICPDCHGKNAYVADRGSTQP